jgi:hypothetical protein
MNVVSTIETVATVVGCEGCGTRAGSPDRVGWRCGIAWASARSINRPSSWPALPSVRTVCYHERPQRAAVPVVHRRSRSRRRGGPPAGGRTRWGGKPRAPRSPSSPHLGAMDHPPSSSRRTPERVPAPLFAPPRHCSPSGSGTASPPVSSGCPAAQRARPVRGIPCQASITVQRSNGRRFRPDRRIFTFTTVRRPFLPDASKADGAFTTVLVELDGPPGVPLVGRLVGGVDLTIGMRVIAKFTNDPDGADGGSSHQTDDFERLMPALLAETGLAEADGRAPTR